LTRPLDAAELHELVDALFQPSALTELGALMLCLALAWLLVRLLRGSPPIDAPIWFGRRIVDGVLFPLLVLELLLPGDAGSLEHPTATTRQSIDERTRMK